MNPRKWGESAGEERPSRYKRAASKQTLGNCRFARGHAVWNNLWSRARNVQVYWYALFESRHDTHDAHGRLRCGLDTEFPNNAPTLDTQVAAYRCLHFQRDLDMIARWTMTHNCRAIFSSFCYRRLTQNKFTNLTNESVEWRDFSTYTQ